jgi:hypothetical protein
MSKHTPERQAEINRKIAEHHRGRPHPHKGHKNSPETRAKISAARMGMVPANKGKAHSPESIRKMILARRRYHLPLAEIAARYFAGEHMVDVLRDYSHLGQPHQEMVRRQLVREGFQRKTRKGKCRGKKNFQWKGGRTPAMHYYRRQSYEIAAICEGKPLRRGEVIHHNDEVKENNAPENLLIFPTNREHMYYHQQLLKLQRAGQKVDTIQLALENGGRQLRRPASLNEWKPDIALRPLLERIDLRTSDQRVRQSILLQESRQR